MVKDIEESNATEVAELWEPRLKEVVCARGDLLRDRISVEQCLCFASFQANTVYAWMRNVKTKY